MFFDSDAFYVALDRKRRAAHMRWRDVATEAGVSASTLTRIGQLKRPDADGLVRLLSWLGDMDVAPFVITDQTSDSPSPSEPTP
jgi:transcriptional regulator with XRE-family HTH domain